MSALAVRLPVRLSPQQEAQDPISGGDVDQDVDVTSKVIALVPAGGDTAAWREPFRDMNLAEVCRRVCDSY
jgi:hypothetical protein